MRITLSLPPAYMAVWLCGLWFSRGEEEEEVKLEVAEWRGGRRIGFLIFVWIGVCKLFIVG